MISYHPIIQKLQIDCAYQLDMLRLDLIDEKISGNKWFKLKHNLQKAISQNKNTIITFGGAFSNHIAATAVACKKFNLTCIAVIRGEEHTVLNDTLKKAKENGMLFYFVDRETYKSKDERIFKDTLQKLFGDHYLIPEGGKNQAGVEGCFEILKKEWDYDYVFCACGTATTFSGIVASKTEKQKIIGISVLKGENTLPLESNLLLKNTLPEIEKPVCGNEALLDNVLKKDCILNSYSFNGYAKLDRNLLNFKNEFEHIYKIPLDHIYTSKLMYGVFDLMKLKKLKLNSKILVIHSGGLQGNKSFEERYHLTPNL